MDRNRMSALILVILCVAGGSTASASQAPAIPDSAAALVFMEAHQLCTADDGELWGHSLCGSMMFVDQATATAVLNGPVSGATRDGAVWRDHLKGDGWSATIKGTFRLAPDVQKPGSYVVVKSEAAVQVP